MEDTDRTTGRDGRQATGSALPGWIVDRTRGVDRWRAGLAALSTVLAVLVLAPMGWLVWEAATVEPTRAIELVVSAGTARIILNSLALMLSVTALSVVIGVPLAVLTTQTDLPYPRVWTIVAALPLVIPSYIGAIAFVSMFGSGGELESLIGVTLPDVRGLGGAIGIITLYTYPYVFLTTRAALVSMDDSLIDAARTLNHGPIATFRRVTVPTIRPGIAAGALLTALYAISDFGTPAFMQASVFTSQIFLEFENYTTPVGYAALLALQLVAIVAVVLVIEAGIGRDQDASGGTASADGTQIRLGGWKWPAMGAVATIGIVTILVPVGIFTSWLFRSEGTRIPALEFDPTVAVHSVSLAGLAAVGACAVALPVAYYAGRSNSRLARLLERTTYLGFAVPGVVIGLALVVVGTRTVPSVYREGVWLLVFGYVVRFLPQAVGTVRSSVLQVDDKTIEAARTLDAGRFEAFRRITLPLIAPGLVAGAVLVFLTTMKELPMTLMLQPIGMDTLVIIVWHAHEALAYRYAAVPALLLVVISGATMLVLLRQEGYDGK